MNVLPLGERRLLAIDSAGAKKILFDFAAARCADRGSFLTVKEIAAGVG
jgi:hypothetical protein